MNFRTEQNTKYLFVVAVVVDYFIIYIYIYLKYFIKFWGEKKMFGTLLAAILVLQNISSEK